MATPREKAKATARKATATARKRRDPLVRAEHQKTIVDGMVAGCTVEEIMAATGLSYATVYREKRKLIEARVDARDTKLIELREAELARLDALQNAHWQAATVGMPVFNRDGEQTGTRLSHDSARIVLDCIKQRSRMLGLDAPTRIDVTQRTQLDAQIESLIEELGSQGLVKS